MFVTENISKMTRAPFVQLVHCTVQLILIWNIWIHPQQEYIVVPLALLFILLNYYSRGSTQNSYSFGFDGYDINTSNHSWQSDLDYTMTKERAHLFQKDFTRMLHRIREFYSHNLQLFTQLRYKFALALEQPISGMVSFMLEPLQNKKCVGQIECNGNFTLSTTIHNMSEIEMSRQDTIAIIMMSIYNCETFSTGFSFSGGLNRYPVTYNRTHIIVRLFQSKFASLVLGTQC